MRRRGRDTSMRTGVIALLILLAAGYATVTRSLPFLGEDGTVVRAVFSAPNQVHDGTPVRVRGVEVGEVKDVRPTDGGRAGIVTMRLTDDTIRPRADASAAVRFRTLLGAAMEIDLDPGQAATALPAATILLRRTTVQTEVDDVLQVFRGDTPAALRSDLHALAGALDGSAAGRLVDTLAPTLTQTPRGLGSLRGERTDDLRELVSATADTARALGVHDDALRGLVSDGAATFSVLAARRGDLAATLRAAPAALDASTTTARAIDATLPVLDDLVADLRPAARALVPASARTRPVAVSLERVLRDARPLLRSLRPAVRALDRATGPGRLLVDGLAPTVRLLDDELIPYLERPDPDIGRPTYQLVGPTFATLAAASAEYDDLGHLLHFPIQPASGSLTAVPCTALVSDPSATEKLRCGALNKALQLALGGRR